MGKVFYYIEAKKTNTKNMEYLLTYLGTCLLATIIIIGLGESENKKEGKKEPLTFESFFGVFFFSALVTPIGAVFLFISDLKKGRE